MMRKKNITLPPGGRISLIATGFHQWQQREGMPYAFAMAGKLYTPVRLPGVRNLVSRVGFLLVLLTGTVLVLYFERGLIDSQTGKEPTLVDCIYFTLITITTVGYGDIVPVTTQARMVDAFLLTPIRFIVIFTFVGTAYQLVIRRLQEEFRMKQAMGRLKGHVIVCGYGATGTAAVRELLLQGTSPDQIVLLEQEPERLKAAAELGIVAVEGDATLETVLQSVAIERAAYILIAPGRDDTAVLIALTAQDMNPDARLVAMCLDEANRKFLERSGVHTIISRAAAGGNLMAAATRRAHLVDTMQDIMTVGGALRMEERKVRPEEVGKRPQALESIAVVRVYRSGEQFDVAKFPALEEGDLIVYVAAGNASTG